MQTTQVGERGRKLLHLLGATNMKVYSGSLLQNIANQSTEVARHFNFTVKKKA